MPEVKYQTQINEEDAASSERIHRPIYKNRKPGVSGPPHVFHTPEVGFQLVQNTHPVFTERPWVSAVKKRCSYKLVGSMLFSVLIAGAVVVLLIAHFHFNQFEGLFRRMAHHTPQPPHILVIIADDYGWNDVGYHGSEIRTPTLDRLAAGGVKLENYYVQQVCTPSRSQFLSGRYQIHTGLQHTSIHPSSPNGLPLDHPTLADVLKKRGYSTHQIGKWHLGFYKKDYMPNNRGFDSVFGYLLGAEDYYNHTRCYDSAGCGFDLRRDTKPAWEEKGKYSANIFADEAVKVIEGNANNHPMFMYLAMQSVHHPLQVPAQYVEPYLFINDTNRRTYAGMVASLDEAVQNVTDALRRTGMYDNSIIVFSTDNGGQVHMGGNNWPLRGLKNTMWEGGLRAVGFVHSPLLKKTGVVTKELIHISDWFPTLAGVAGASTKGLQLDGVDVWEAVSKGGSSPRVELLHNIDPLNVSVALQRYPHPFDTRVLSGIRVGEWKLLTGNPGDHRRYSLPGYTYHEADTVTPQQYSQSVFLYNIANDPLETTDLSQTRSDIVVRLLDRLAYYNSTAVPCRFPAGDPKANPEYHGGVWGPWM